MAVLRSLVCLLAAQSPKLKGIPGEQASQALSLHRMGSKIDSAVIQSVSSVTVQVES